MQHVSGNEIRTRYLRFFEQRGHTIVSSSPVVTAHDPTLYFANSGMVQFKDVFLGLEKRPYSRAVTAQKCMRVSGKHNDLEEVGPSPRHHTAFEMLGNFSFGDYFKAEAIAMAWELLTREFQLPVERLWFTVFGGDTQLGVPPDEEAEQLWIKVGAHPARVLRYGAKDNFWVMGDTGPCGPCSEITCYIGADMDRMTPLGVNSDDPDYVEIWNNVFMQFDRATMQPLPRPSVDTGMGLERMAMVLQGVHSTYETDLFTPIITRTRALTGGDEDHYRRHFAAYRAVADHSRACVFLIADGLLPGKDGRAYVLRRILRRAAYLGRTIGLEQPFLAETTAAVIDVLGEAYPEFGEKRAFIQRIVTEEEQRFGRTLGSGMVLLDRALARLPAGAPFPGREAFELYDTHGFPLDLTQKIVAARGLAVDEAGFEAEMQAQRQRGRDSSKFRRATEAELWSDRSLPESVFLGYQHSSAPARVLALVADGEDVSMAQPGQQLQVVLDQTPFYAESGGQVGDTGVLRGPHGTLTVQDVQRPVPGLIVHLGVLNGGPLAVGEQVTAVVDAERRADIKRNHTATHLLHRALRLTLGTHTEQRGSLVAPDRLRFDFSHQQALDPDELRRIEQFVNAWVRCDAPVRWEITSQQVARERGAMMLFGEKYGDQVRMVTVGCDDALVPDFCSIELCGGTHVDRTGEIGYFRVIAESAIGSGLRRIEALTGRAAEQWVEQQAATLRTLAARLGVQPAQLGERIDALLAEQKQQRAELDSLRSQASRAQLEQLLASVQRHDGVAFLVARLDAPDSTRLREMGDWLRDKLGSAIVVLGAVIDGKPQVLATITPDLVARGYHAGKLVGPLAKAMGGGGGGRAEMAQAGGRDLNQLDQALAMVAGLIAAQG